MPAWVCGCVCACQPRPQASWPKSTRACMLEVCSSSVCCVCMCAWEHHFRLTALTHTQSVSLLPSSSPPWRSQLICRLMANQCAANVSNGAAAVPHTHNHSLSRFLQSNHSTIIIIIPIPIPFIILVQRSVNVLMTLEWVLHFCCCFRRLTLNCAYYLYIRNQLTISSPY